MHGMSICSSMVSVTRYPGDKSGAIAIAVSRKDVAHRGTGMCHVVVLVLYKNSTWDLSIRNFLTKRKVMIA